MPTNTLTDARCKGAKPAEKPYKLFDGGGLHLYVSATGSRTWRLAYRVAGKPQTMSLGPYPEVSLSEARAKRDEAKKALIDGKDPMAPRRISRQAMTLKEASDAYWAGRKDVSASYRSNAERGIEMHLVRLLARPISTIERAEASEKREGKIKGEGTWPCSMPSQCCVSLGTTPHQLRAALGADTR